MAFVRHLSRSARLATVLRSQAYEGQTLRAAATHAAPYHISRSLRLATLLRSFNVPPEQLQSQDSKAIMASVKAEYLRRAKEQHPDVAAEELQHDAEDKFKALHEDFTETGELLEAGVVFRNVPSMRQHWSGVSAETVEAEYGGNIRRPTGYHPSEFADYEAGPRYPVMKSKIDTITRVKCNVIFWSCFLGFIMFLREFLVWSAGSTYSWSRPADLNPFWIRRYQNDWVDIAGDDRKPIAADSPEAMKKAKVDAKVKKLDQKKDRGMDDFYKKRHISNVKRKYSPRGAGGPSI